MSRAYNPRNSSAIVLALAAAGCAASNPPSVGNAAPSVTCSPVSAPAVAASTIVASSKESPGESTAPSARPSDVVAAPVPKPEAEAPEGMLLVPGGEFEMGANSGGEEDEHPAHRVTVKSYYLDRLEVTVEQYLDCVRSNHCRMYREDAARSFKAGEDVRYRQPKQPISGVSWDDAVAYCAWQGKRLPTEAEWERAARGDDNRIYPWGNAPPDPTKHGCFGHHTGPNMVPTCEVGSYPNSPGPYGHQDLAGNVWEWTHDDYDPYAYRRGSAAQGIPGRCDEILKTQNDLRAAGRQGFTGKNPIPTTCEKVLRGGAFNYPGNGLRATNRVHHPGSWRMLVAGFRCAKDIAP